MRGFKPIVLSSVSGFALVFAAVPAVAQIATDDPAQAAPVDSVPPPDDSGEVVVTGSRIARPEISAPNPILSIGVATLERSGRTNITDFLIQNPALLGSSTSADQSGSTGDFGGTGINLLNLRNLGSNRTLVLVDGRRHVAGLSRQRVG